jgi:DNA polymerase IV
LRLELPLRFRSSAEKQGPRTGSVVEAFSWRVDRSINAIRVKFGRSAVRYSASALSADDRVPEEFRELAERGPDNSQE